MCVNFYSIKGGELPVIIHKMKKLHSVVIITRDFYEILNMNRSRSMASFPSLASGQTHSGDTV